MRYSNKLGAQRTKPKDRVDDILKGIQHPSLLDLVRCTLGTISDGAECATHLYKPCRHPPNLYGENTMPICWIQQNNHGHLPYELTKENSPQLFCLSRRTSPRTQVRRVTHGAASPIRPHQAWGDHCQLTVHVNHTPLTIQRGLGSPTRGNEEQST